MAKQTATRGVSTCYSSANAAGVDSAESPKLATLFDRDMLSGPSERQSCSCNWACLLKTYPQHSTTSISESVLALPSLTNGSLKFTPKWEPVFFWPQKTIHRGCRGFICWGTLGRLGPLQLPPFLVVENDGTSSWWHLNRVSQPAMMKMYL